MQNHVTSKLGPIDEVIKKEYNLKEATSALDSSADTRQTVKVTQQADDDSTEGRLNTLFEQNSVNDMCLPTNSGSGQLTGSLKTLNTLTVFVLNSHPSTCG
ncbi:hypothetical protein CEUSTIGMA_g7255.t1 [Chlamydomonas eustigma]|uniref:Uncharacterized protein n=1 Tax=Chlamydomonas eustigma TaxID=1157962 RepID=A0A250X9N4_9CHLO|nr:hypothetical protein CEUSTIGMA_g7255.t1 [Chlamydomonas eustigma]|eukprot:GAX79815.1 hypothetical protein CEUSTIGMA_g7255.t1 [Chlamydomonas eustigma]